MQSAMIDILNIMFSFISHMYIESLEAFRRGKTKSLLFIRKASLSMVDWDDWWESEIKQTREIDLEVIQ